jgi:hypothetical protein
MLKLAEQFSVKENHNGIENEVVRAGIILASRNCFIAIKKYLTIKSPLSRCSKTFIPDHFIHVGCLWLWAIHTFGFKTFCYFSPKCIVFVNNFFFLSLKKVNLIIDIIVIIMINLNNNKS